MPSGTEMFDHAELGNLTTGSYCFVSAYRIF